MGGQVTGTTVGLIFLLMASAVLILVFTPPFVSSDWSAMIKLAFSAVCHQMPERSFHIAESSLAVCHRCTGIYAGVPLAMTLVTFTYGRGLTKKVLGLLLFASLLLMGLDWGLTVVELWENTMLSRTATGALFGLAAGAYLAIVLRPRKGSGSVEIP